MESREEKADLESDGEIPYSSSPDESIGHSMDVEMAHMHSSSHAAKLQTFNFMRISLPRSIYIVLIKAKINVLLPYGPLAIFLHYTTKKQGWVFFFSFLGTIPLAKCLGYASDQLSLYTGHTGGGLLNTTFSNATEMIISIKALNKGKIRVVQLSLLGSILSNMLLVLGCAFFTGGIINYNKVQMFSKAAATENSSIMFMALMGIMFPAVLHFTSTEVHFGKSELSLSRFSSCIMLVAYSSYVFFQLRSKPNLYCPVDWEGENDEYSDKEECPELTQWEAIGWLAILTGCVSIVSGYLVDAVMGPFDSLDMPITFISVILLPVVGKIGNVVDSFSPMMFAMKDKLDFTLGIAIGSTTQVSMFVIPSCVVVGWIMGKPMDLNFQLFETAIVFVSVLVVAFMLQSGTSHYFKGLILILCYLIVAASFFVHVDPTSDDAYSGKK